MEALDSELIQNICENLFNGRSVHKFTELTKNVEKLLGKTERAGELGHNSSMQYIYMRNLYNLKTNIELGLKMIVNHLQDSSYYCLVSDSATYVKKFCKSSRRLDPSVESFMNGLHNNFKKQLDELLAEVAEKLIANDLKAISRVIEFLRDQEDCFKQIYSELKPDNPNTKKKGLFGALKNIYTNMTDSKDLKPLYDKLEIVVTKKYDLYANNRDFDFTDICEEISGQLPEDDALMFYNMVFFYKLAEDLVDECLESLETDKFIPGEEIALYKLDMLKRFDNFFKQKIETRTSYNNLKQHMTCIWHAFAASSKTLVASQSSLYCHNYTEFKALYTSLMVYFKTGYKKSLREIFNFEGNFYLLEKYADRLSQTLACNLLELKGDIIDDLKVLDPYKQPIEDKIAASQAIKAVREPLVLYCLIAVIEAIEVRTKFFSRHVANRHVELLYFFAQRFNALVKGDISARLVDHVKNNELDAAKQLIGKIKEERNLYKIDTIDELVSLVSAIIHLVFENASRFVDAQWKYTNYSMEMMCEDAVTETICNLNQTLLSRHQLIMLTRWVVHFAYNSHENMLDTLIRVVHEQKLEFHTLVSNGSKTMILGVSGFLSEDSDKSEEWMQLVFQCDFNDIVALNWSSDNFENLTNNIWPTLHNTISTNFANRETEHGNSKLLSGINVVLDLYKDNPFIKAYKNAEVTGAHLCEAMLQTSEFRAHRRLDIVSFSLGTVVALNMLLTLEQSGSESLKAGVNDFYLGDVVLMGSCVDQKQFLNNVHRLIGTNGIVKGRLIVVFTKNDSVLKYLFKLARLNENAIGFHNITVDEVVDALHNQDAYLGKLQKCEIEAIVRNKFSCYDLTGVIESHGDYRKKLGYVLKIIGFKNSYDFLDDRHVNSQ